MNIWLLPSRNNGQNPELIWHVLHTQRFVNKDAEPSRKMMRRMADVAMIEGEALTNPLREIVEKMLTNR